jgi:heme A synthase
MPFTNKPFGTEDKIKMFERMGATAAVIALIIIMLIESGRVGEYKNLADMGLTAMIVVLAISLTGSLYFKTRKK